MAFVTSLGVGSGSDVEVDVGAVDASEAEAMNAAGSRRPLTTLCNIDESLFPRQV